MEPATLEGLSTKSAEEVMAVRFYAGGVLLAGVLITLSGFGASAPPVFAAPAKQKKEAKQPVVQPPAADRQISASIPKAGVRKPARAESGKKVDVESSGQTPPHQAPRNIRRHHKSGKKLRPPAIVAPKPDLSYHGILEQPQRYDPSRDRRAGRAPNPQAGELLHDHFQELDKNHDGMIDPFERALGRLDIDRDLSNRQWE
jgi:hypothetical protein